MLIRYIFVFHNSIIVRIIKGIPHPLKIKGSGMTGTKGVGGWGVTGIFYCPYKAFLLFFCIR